MVSEETAVSKHARRGSPTSGFERLLLLLSIIALPAEDHFRFVPGFSLLFIAFGTMAIYVVMQRSSELFRILSHPVFLAAYAFLFVGSLIELTHDNNSYYDLSRIAQMIVGAILVASMCRDLPALKMACHGYLIAGLWLAILLFLTSYGVLNQAGTLNFHEASKLREMAFEGNPLQANLNHMAFGAGQATVVALSWALTARAPLFRNFYIGAGLICMVAAFLPLSRGGVVIAIASCASVMYAFGLQRGKAILITVLLGAAILIWVPQSVWSRMTFSFEEHDGKREGRALVYQAAIDHLPEYIFTGVGAGNFWSSWGRRSEFAGQGHFRGAHNCFIQVTLYWGIIGLMAFLLVFWCAYRCVPRFCNREAAALSLLGIGASCLLFSMVVHTLYAKEFSLGLGLLVGAHCWIWPQGIVYPVSGIRRARL